MDLQELNNIIKKIKKPNSIGANVNDILKELDKD